MLKTFNKFYLSKADESPKFNPQFIPKMAKRLSSAWKSFPNPPVILMFLSIAKLILPTDLSLLIVPCRLRYS